MRRLTRVLQIAERVLDLVEGEGRAVEALEKTIELLEKQHRELFDRLMARDWDSFVMKQQVAIGYGDRAEGEEIPEDADEMNAGEILEIEG